MNGNGHRLTILFFDKLNSIYSDTALEAPTMKKLYKMLVAAINSRHFRQEFYRAQNINSFMKHEGAAEVDVQTGNSNLPFITKCKEYKLTNRETDVMIKKNEGMTDAEAAVSLSISPETINSHLTRIYQKLQVNSITTALNKLKS